MLLSAVPAFTHKSKLFDHHGPDDFVCRSIRYADPKSNPYGYRAARVENRNRIMKKPTRILALAVVVAWEVCAHSAQAQVQATLRVPDRRITRIARRCGSRPRHARGKDSRKGFSHHNGGGEAL